MNFHEGSFLKYFSLSFSLKDTSIKSFLTSRPRFLRLEGAGWWVFSGLFARKCLQKTESMKKLEKRANISSEAYCEDNNVKQSHFTPEGWSFFWFLGKNRTFRRSWPNPISCFTFFCSSQIVLFQTFLPFCFVAEPIWIETVELVFWGKRVKTSKRHLETSSLPS